MMRISLDTPALIAVHTWLAGFAKQTRPRVGRRGGSTAARARFTGERLEPRMMLDAGMRAFLPDLVDASDTGTSNVDNLTFERTPTLTGSATRGASQVRLFIDGRPGDVLPVTDGTWNYTVPAEAALAAGRHTFAVRPVGASGQEGRLSRPLNVRIITSGPAAPSVRLAESSDSGVTNDGRTIVNQPTLSGVAPRGAWVDVSIDGAFAGRVKSHAKTGTWSLKAPRLADGVHDVAAVAENREGLRSAATSFAVTVNGQRTVMLDASNRQTIELTPEHILGQGTQGFTVTQVLRGTLQRWSEARNAWVTIPTAPLATNAATLRNPPASRTIAFNDLVRWTPASGDAGMAPAFVIRPLDAAGGRSAPIPEAGTVPGAVVDPLVDAGAGVGIAITWSAPTDGCGCASTRYSIEVTAEDGQTRLYNVPSSVLNIMSVEGGLIGRARIWGATKTGAGEARTFDATAAAESLARLHYTIRSGTSFASLGQKAKAQLAASPTGVAFTSSFPIGSTHSDLAYLEVQALPDAVETAQGLPAGTPLLISSESNKLTPAQRADLQANPIYAGYLFPGTVDGQVQPDQARLHFQAGETLRFAGTVDERVRGRATIVVEEALILRDGSLGHWFTKARIPVEADGGYSYDHEVQYGMTSVRARLEVDNGPAPSALGATDDSSVAASSSAQQPVSTSIPLSYNAFGITTAPWQVANSQGFDRHGNYYNSNYTGGSTSDPVAGAPITWAGIEFPIGPVPTDNNQVGESKGPQNFVQAKGQTITVPAPALDPSETGSSHSHTLYLAGAAANGNQVAQQITLTFTDGTTETWTQSFTDWSNNGSTAQPEPYSGEWVVETQPERINQKGNLTTPAAYVYAYGYNLHGKQLASITLPNNENVGILSAVVAQAPMIAIDKGVDWFAIGTVSVVGVDLMTLSIRNESNLGAGGGPLTFFFADQAVAGSSQSSAYTSKQVTVPMGQEQTIVYVAPNDSSQMNFYVQKGDDTCFGPNCSTYLTDWNDGSTSHAARAANISPSLNSQMKAGQHWTMTIQNAGYGYDGYLYSPSGQNLPGGNRTTPAGAQFKLMTEAEIKAQPPWATWLEIEIGLMIGLVIVSVATGGAADVAAVEYEVIGGVDEAAGGASVDVAADTAVDGGEAVDGGDEASERVAVDQSSENVLMNLDMETSSDLDLDETEIWEKNAARYAEENMDEETRNMYSYMQKMGPWRMGPTPPGW